MKDPKPVSRDVVNSGHGSSIQGYLNWKEATSLIIATLGFATATDLFSSIFKALAENVDAWYGGPNGPTVVWILGTIASFLGARRVAKKYRDDGRPILFSKDEDENDDA